MSEDIEIEKLKSALSGKISDPLLDLIISENTPLRIAEICLENGVAKEEDIEKAGYGICLVLLGQLPPTGLPIFLEKGLKINNDIAVKIYRKISEVIFSAVKDDLSKLYNLTQDEKEKTEEMPEELIKPLGKDIYKEPIE